LIKTEATKGFSSRYLASFSTIEANFTTSSKDKEESYNKEERLLQNGVAGFLLLFGEKYKEKNSRYQEKENLLNW
jgi:hypothetical protein